MVKDMALIAAECIKNPHRSSIWLPEEGKYICPASEDALKHYERVAVAQQRSVETAERNPPLNPQFKLVFLTAAGGTLLFVVLCVVLSFATKGTPPPLFEKVIMGIFDLAKIGFGAVVGLLGGKKLQIDESAARANA